MGEFGRYSGQSAGRALESLREMLATSGPAENQLGAMRRERALTQAALASRSGVSQGYVSEVEFQGVLAQADRVGRMISGLMGYLRRSSIKGVRHM